MCILGRVSSSARFGDQAGPFSGNLVGRTHCSNYQKNREDRVRERLFWQATGFLPQTTNSQRSSCRDHSACPANAGLSAPTAAPSTSTEPKTSETSQKELESDFFPSRNPGCQRHLTGSRDLCALALAPCPVTSSIAARRSTSYECELVAIAIRRGPRA